MTSAVLLAQDEVTLYAPDGEADGHGWILPPEPIPFWVGLANVQIAYGTASTGANAGGGNGPYRPLTSLAGTAFLPADAAPKDGMVLQLSATGRQYVLSVVRWVSDPAGGGIGCYACNLVGYAERG